uniref:Uncharacterized protein n=1 Tax=Nelumbo nucifera TaxID=4432 RepID=A0A822XQQ0_NELNU|nr:TPA_asm: hypothetical protein HUJ06_023825 [Nelumbo nucifera]
MGRAASNTRQKLHISHVVFNEDGMVP